MIGKSTVKKGFPERIHAPEAVRAEKYPCPLERKCAREQ
jgi:hypothetical protein